MRHFNEWYWMKSISSSSSSLAWKWGHLWEVPLWEGGREDQIYLLVFRFLLPSSITIAKSPPSEALQPSIIRQASINFLLFYKFIRFDTTLISKFFVAGSPGLLSSSRRQRLTLPRISIRYGCNPTSTAESSRFYTLSALDLGFHILILIVGKTLISNF